MDMASRKQSEYRANRLIKAIVLILIGAVAVWVLVAATFALIELNWKSHIARSIGCSNSCR